MNGKVLFSLEKKNVVCCNFDLIALGAIFTDVALFILLYIVKNIILFSLIFAHIPAISIWYSFTPYYEKIYFMI